MEVRGGGQTPPLGITLQSCMSFTHLHPHSLKLCGEHCNGFLLTSWVHYCTFPPAGYYYFTHSYGAFPLLWSSCLCFFKYRIWLILSLVVIPIARIWKMWGTWSLRTTNERRGGIAAQRQLRTGEVTLCWKCSILNDDGTPRGGTPDLETCK